MRETIELQEGDSISVVRDRLEQAESRQVALIVPRGLMLLRSEINLTLVRRFAEALALDLVLVTEDRAVARQARLVGIRTVANVPAAWRVRAQKAAPIPHQVAPLDRPAATRDVFLKPDSYRPTRFDKRTGPVLWARWSLIVGAVVVLVAGSFIAAAVALPSATVSLDLVGEKVTTESEIVASIDLREVDYEQRRVPARRAQIEVVGEETGQTTAKETQPDKHATGEVVFANKTTDEVIVPKGTVVRTSDGLPVKFYTLLDTRVPGSFGATARVPIMAFEPGPVGNVQALTIRVVEGEPSYKVEVLNDKATQGGSEKRVGIVSPADCDRLRASMMQRLQQEAYSRLVAGLVSGEWIPPDSVDVVIVQETFDKKVGEQAEMLRLTMKVRVSGLAVDGQAARALLSRLMDTRRTAGLVLSDATLEVQQPVGRATVSGQTVRFKAAGSALLVPALDVAEVSKRLAGQDRQEALRWLEGLCAQRKPPIVAVQPTWWPRLPWLASRIRVELGER